MTLPYRRDLKALCCHLQERGAPKNNDLFLIVIIYLHIDLMSQKHVNWCLMTLRSIIIASVSFSSLSNMAFTSEVEPSREQ